MNTSKVKQFNLGDFVGQWTVLEYVGEKGKGRNSYWKCRCSCGEIREVCGSSLRSGKSTKCQRCSSKANGRFGINRKAKGDLYVVQCGPYFKIGSSDNPERRIRDLQSSCPYPIETVLIKRGWGRFEPVFHKTFADQHHHGEWFMGDATEVNFLV